MRLCECERETCRQVRVLTSFMKQPLKTLQKVGVEALHLLPGSPELPGPPRLTKTRISGLQCPPLGEPGPCEQANDSKYLLRAGSCCGFTPTTTCFTHTILQNPLFLHRRINICMRVIVRVVVRFKKEKSLFLFQTQQLPQQLPVSECLFLQYKTMDSGSSTVILG